MSRFVPLLLLLALAAPLLPAALAGEEDRATTEELTPLERWHRMSPAERREMERRFARFRELSPEKRRQLTVHGERLESRRRRAEAWLTDEQRARVAELPPERRRSVLREYFRQESLADGERVRTKLPPELVERLQQAEPIERSTILAEFQSGRTRATARRVLEHLGLEAGIGDEERARWNDLDEEAQGALVLELGRDFVRRRVAELGPPGDLAAADWERIDALGDVAFFDVWRRLQPGPEYTLGTFGGRSRSAEPDDAVAAATGGPTEAPAETNASDAAAVDVDEEARRQVRRAWLRVRAQAKPTIDDLIELADRPADERRAELAARGRDRVLRYLRLSGLAAPAELEALEALDGRAFHEHVRELVAEHVR